MRNYWVWAPTAAVGVIVLAGCGAAVPAVGHLGAASGAPTPSISTTARLRRSTTTASSPSVVDGYSGATPSPSIEMPVSKPPVPSPGPTGSAGMPPAFESYRQVLAAVGPILARRSSVPVYLPQYHWDYSGTLDVVFKIQNGYQITVGGGPALPANSPKIDMGNAETFYTVMGLPWSNGYQNGYLPLEPAAPSSDRGTLALAQDVVAATYPAVHAGTQSSEGSMLVTWHQDGWTLNVTGSGVGQGIIVGEAQSLARSLMGQTLPGTHGRATFSIGSDAPSMASYDLKSTRYIIEAPGFRAVTLARAMERMPS